jgi:hypothetical protein
VLGAALASAAHAAILREWPPSGRPPGYQLTAEQAVTVADQTGVVARAHSRYGQLTVSAASYGTRRWQISYMADDRLRAEVHVDDRTGRVAAAWEGAKLAWRGTRGSKALHDEGETGALTNATWVWVLLSLLFVAPFVDPRRPFRMLHLDLLALLGFAIPHVLLDHGSYEPAVMLSWLLLAYLAVRFTVAGVRGVRARDEPLVPFVPQWALAAGLAVLVVGRAIANLADSVAGDVAYAGVAGADRISRGLDLYTGGGARYDTYGPVNYLAYWPFEQLFPLKGVGDEHLWAAHVAAIVFDLAVAGVLFWFGRRSRPGRAGMALGLALAYAWAAFPYSWYVLSWNTNDALVPALAVPALGTAPVIAGIMLGLAAAAKFGPAAIGPLLAAQTRLRSGFGSALALSAAFVVVVVVTIAIFLPDGGIKEFYDATIGFQIHRHTPFSPWGIHSWLEPLRVIAQIGFAALVVAALWTRRVRDPITLCAWAAATMVALQLTLSYWVETYIVWWAAFALLATFGAWSTSQR